IAVDCLSARAVQECRGRSDLQWFEPVATAPGFSHALASTITELRLNNIDVEVLRRVRPGGVDLALLASAYGQYLSDAGLADSAEIYRTAAVIVSDRQHRFDRFPLLLLDVAPRSEAQRAFLRSLADRAGAVLAVFSPRDGRSVVFFQHVLNTKAEDAGNSDSTALDRLREHIFSTFTPPETDGDDTVDFRSATDEARECVEIARSVHRAAELGVPFDKMAILLRNPEAYQTLVEDALRRAGIPAFFSRGSRRPNPAGRALLALLACAAEGLSASRFAEYLSLGQVTEPDDKGEPPKRDPGWVPVQGELFPELSNQRWTAEDGPLK